MGAKPFKVLMAVFPHTDPHHVFPHGHDLNKGLCAR
jgi:hypothetical protein